LIEKKRTAKDAAAKVRPAPPDAAQQALAKVLPPQARLGTSSWSSPAGPDWSGMAAYVTINNKAEGSVLALAQALSAQALPAGTCHPVD
jgi:hypothetical protein